jgi:hypothetical protein
LAEQFFANGRDPDWQKRQEALMGWAPGAIKGLLGRVGSGLAPGAAGTVIEQAMGVAPNPWLTVVYQGPNFKDFKFSWKFSPDTAADSTVLLSVLNTFKKNMHSNLNAATNGVYLDYPRMVRPRFVPNDNTLWTFKYCVLKEVVVNWASGGLPAFFHQTMAPVEVELVIVLQEIELWFRNDQYIGALE